MTATARAGVCAGALVAIGARPDEAQYALHDAFEKALARNEQVGRPEGWLLSRRGSGDNIAFARRSSARYLYSPRVLWSRTPRAEALITVGGLLPASCFFQAAYLTRVSLEQQYQFVRK